MPTTYAHDRFGREVYQQLPKDLQEKIRRHKKIYLIGLHGPDLFFYYHPFVKNRISDLGTMLHEQKASVFFQQKIQEFQEEPSEAVEVYLLGFACHFLLDSSCHPYIGDYVAETGISHARIETCLDQELMLEDQKDPLCYRPASSICPHNHDLFAITRCFPMVSEEKVIECLRGMKRYTNVTICRHDLSRNILYFLMRLVGCYDSMGGRVMPKKRDPKCANGVNVLGKLYEQALMEAPEQLVLLDRALQGKEKLSDRFECNFE